MNNFYHIFSISSLYWLGFLIFLALISYRAKFLTRSGLIAAMFVGSVIFVTGGDKWISPLILFFLLSSILNSIGAYLHKTAESEHFPRTAKQVLANGSIAALSAAGYLIIPNPALIILFLGSLAAATSDTWSTEIGAFSSTQPRLLTNFRKVQKGTSGGITLIGIFGGIAGSAALAFSGFIIFDGNSRMLYVDSGITSVFLGGIIGNLFDSFLGVTLQSKNRCVVCDNTTEETSHCGKPAFHSSGLRLLNNDGVNFLCSLTGGLTAVFYWQLFR